MQSTTIKHRNTVKEILENEGLINQKVSVMGWVRTFRNNQFLSLNDGTSLDPIQVVIKLESLDESLLKRLTTGASVSVKGTLVKSLGGKQKVEIQNDFLEILGDSDPEKFPLQPKKHSLEFLRENAHLRMRTNTFQAVFRVRNVLAFAVHEFFQKRGFIYINTPIITGSDAEGAGEMFRVTTLDLNQLPRLENGKIDFSEDFFGKETNLTVSGQLEGELAAMALGNIYTFGPTFRAENSNTTRHLAEFWMIEPEMAFYDLDDNMSLAEDLLKFTIDQAIKQCPRELEFLNERFLDEENTKPQKDRSEMSLMSKLHFCLENPFQRLTYTEAIEILKESKPNRSKKFKYLITEWGVDLQSEHERYLVEHHFKRPVILTDYPKTIKAFYMRQNEDGKTVRAMDILFPGIGEMVGGSQREERYAVMIDRMLEMNIPIEEMSWYLDTRRFGTAPHSGFGLGFERLTQFVTGMGNIRDVIPFPRAPKSADF